VRIQDILRTGALPDLRAGARLVLCAGALLVFLAPPGHAQRATAPKLGVDGLVVFRNQGSVAILAEATPFWQPISTRSEELLGEFRYMPEYASAKAKGQVFRVVEAESSTGVGEPGERFVVVPWTFGPGCSGDGWNRSDWVAPGDTVAFLLSPTRARSRGDAEVPVFDVLGWHQPYPVGELIPFWRNTREGNRDWLSASEFFQLLTRIPSELAFSADPEASLGPALRWAGEKPGRASIFPVAEILGRWKELRASLEEAR